MHACISCVLVFQYLAKIDDLFCVG